MTIEEFAKRSAQRAYLEKKCRDADTISKKVFDQIKWERDLAVSQLEALGYSLGEKLKTDGDLISRQAAFEALNCINGTAELDKAFEAIESLPSAQPEIVRCKDCEYCVPGYITDNDDFIPSRCGRLRQTVRISGDDYCSFGERKTDEGFD